MFTLGWVYSVLSDDFSPFKGGLFHCLSGVLGVHITQHLGLLGYRGYRLLEVQRHLFANLMHSVERYVASRAFNRNVTEKLPNLIQPPDTAVVVSHGHQ